METFDEMRTKRGRLFTVHAIVSGAIAHQAEREFRGRLDRIRRPLPAKVPDEVAGELRARLSQTGNEPATHLAMSGPLEADLAADVGAYLEAMPPGQVDAVIVDEVGALVWTKADGFKPPATSPATFAALIDAAPGHLKPIT